MGKWLNDLFNKHMLVRRLLVFWAIILITLVVLHVIEITKQIDMASASVLTAIIGILATVTGFYIKLRETDGRDNDMDGDS